MTRITLDIIGGQLTLKTEQSEDASMTELVIAALYQSSINGLMESPAMAVLVSMAVETSPVIINGKTYTLAQLVSMGLANTKMLQQTVFDDQA